MATFPYACDWSPAPDMPLRRLTAQMGDGYEQRVTDGLNPYLPTWSVNFTKRSETEAKAIHAWLRANNAGVTAFDWTSPDGTVGKFVADKMTPAYPTAFNNWATHAAFRQVIG